MTPATARLLPLAVVPFLLWRVYARMRHSVGLQRLSPQRLVGRILIFVVLILLVAVTALRDVTLLGSLGAGVIGGALLSIIGLRLTRFSDTPQGVCYTPSTPIGIGLALIFLIRILYRLIYFSFSSLAGDGMRIPAFSQSPLTLFLFGLPAGYYVAYHAALLRHPRNVD